MKHKLTFRYSCFSKMHNLSFIIIYFQSSFTTAAVYSVYHSLFGLCQENQVICIKRTTTAKKTYFSVADSDPPLHNDAVHYHEVDLSL